MKKRTKKYQPKPINPNAIFDAIHLSMPVSDTAKETLEMDIRTALVAFTKGIAQKAHFDILASTVDLCLMASQTMFDKAYMNEINQARYAMIRCRERFIRTDRLGLDGEGFEAIKVVIDVHSELLNHLTGKEVETFLKTRELNIRSGNYHRTDRIAA